MVSLFLVSFFIMVSLFLVSFFIMVGLFHDSSLSIMVFLVSFFIMVSLFLVSFFISRCWCGNWGGIGSKSRRYADCK